MADIFISYKRHDRSVVQRIYEALSREGFDVYIDAKLEAGTTYVRELHQQVENAHCVVVVWSQGAIDSDYVTGEALIGHHRGVLVPVTIEHELRLRPPFNAQHYTSLVDWDGSASPEWLELVAQVRRVVDASRAKIQGPSATALADDLGKAHAMFIPMMEDIAKPLIRLAEDPLFDFTAIAGQVAEAVKTIKRDDLFTISVVGRFKVGKSTLINALLGPSEVANGMRVPLATDDDPCTVAITKLRFGDRPQVVPVGRPPGPGLPARLYDELPFDAYFAGARIYVNGDNMSETFNDVEAFNVSWPARLLENGVSLIDTPGCSEDERRTTAAMKAVTASDAAIVVYRSDQLAGTDEQEFARLVTRQVGKVFTIVNLRGKHRMPVSIELEKIIRDRLGLRSERSLHEQGVYCVDLLEAETASLRGDGWLAESSGLLAVQRRLATFLVTERYLAHVRRALKAIAPLGDGLAGSLNAMAASANGSVDEVERVLAECNRVLSSIGETRARIGSIVDNAQHKVAERAVEGFRATLDKTIKSMGERLEKQSIPELDGTLNKFMAGTFSNKKALGKVKELIDSIVRDDMDSWSGALTKEFMPLVDEMRERIESEHREISRGLERMHSQIAELNPALGREGRLIGASTYISNAGAVDLVLSPRLGTLKGATGVGGWGGIAGGVAGGIGTVMLHVVVSSVLPVSVLAAGIAIGSGLGAMGKIEQRVKTSAWDATRPQLEALAKDKSAEERVRSEVAQWFRSIRRQVTVFYERIQDAETEVVERMARLKNERGQSSALLERINAELRNIEACTEKARKLEASLAKAV